MKKSALILSLVLLGAVSSVAVAAGSEAEKKACHGDVRKFCSDVREGSGDNAFLQCLQAHREKLSSKCKGVLESNGV